MRKFRCGTFPWNTKKKRVFMQKDLVKSPQLCYNVFNEREGSTNQLLPSPASAGRNKNYIMAHSSNK